MTSIVFSQWKADNPNWKVEHRVYQRDDDRFQRIVCRWSETNDLTHQYHAVLDVKTGSIYLDCRKRKIMMKHLAAAFLRPLVLTTKTAWHLSMIPIVLQAVKYFKHEQSGKDALKNSLNSLSDMGKTPIFTVAMFVVDVAAVILFPISPNLVYYTRMINGKMERNLSRSEDRLPFNIFAITPCFSPVRRMTVNEKGTVIVSSDIPKILHNMAESQILFRKENRHILNDCGKIYPSGVVYQSAAASPKKMAHAGIS